MGKAGTLYTTPINLLYYGDLLKNHHPEKLRSHNYLPRYLGKTRSYT